MSDGTYQCKCCLCSSLFFGHKRAVTCPECRRKETATDPLKEWEDMAHEGLENNNMALAVVGYQRLAAHLKSQLAKAKQERDEAIKAKEVAEREEDTYSELAERMAESSYEVAKHLETGQKVHDGRTNLAGYWRWVRFYDCVGDYPEISELVAAGNVGAAFDIGRMEGELETANDEYNQVYCDLEESKSVAADWKELTLALEVQMSTKELLTIRELMDQLHVDGNRGHQSDTYYVSRAQFGKLWAETDAKVRVPIQLDVFGNPIAIPANHGFRQLVIHMPWGPVAIRTVTTF